MLSGPGAAPFFDVFYRDSKFRGKNPRLLAVDFIQRSTIDRSIEMHICEDSHNPAHGAGALLVGLSKRKDVVQSVVVFAIQVLSNTENPREIEGAFRMLGEVYAQLIKTKKYKDNVEQLLNNIVVGRLRDPSKFVRARAIWCIRRYAEARFFHTESLAKIIECLLNCLSDQHEELLVQVEAALAIRSLLKHQKKVHAIVKRSMGVIILNVLRLIGKTQIEDVIYVVDEFLEQYIDEVVPVASQVADHLCTMFSNILNSDAVEDSAPTLSNLIQTIDNMIDAVKDRMTIMVEVEASVLKVVNTILDLESYELSPVLYLYIVTNTESFLAFPHRIEAVLDMCCIVLKDDNTFGDKNHPYAAKLMECVLLECPSHTAKVIPAILMSVFDRLTKPFEDDLDELKPYLIIVIVAALYVNLEATLQTFREIDPENRNLVDYVCDELLSCYKKMEGIHNRYFQSSIEKVVSLVIAIL
ncbi:hypothetical protein KIN20_015797 [Parelaphostrongylus tenuis]|uniref:Uncharacterized protein n=1 Tax=Parelaphostrongylus tenuis TaxID=148309 RepID=A0AAD5N0Q9_PARTN|nr:hypothetical protein KIN20_015797 [Parelaphostrongylus tenuis]